MAMLPARAGRRIKGSEAVISVRYIVDNVEQAIPFYRDLLGFKVDIHPAPGFAALSHGELRLLLNQPGAGGAGQSTPGGEAPTPGGWNRFQIEVSDLDGIVAALRAQDCTFRGDIVQGNGGRQILAEDPSGNPVEIFESGRR
jgi:catechol 2,3-dioxygenase-like lactoylglutathione lyase family enzyme